MIRSQKQNENLTSEKKENLEEIKTNKKFEKNAEKEAKNNAKSEIKVSKDGKKESKTTSKMASKKPFLDDMAKKEFAKIGLSVTMGLTVLSAFDLRSRFSRNLHLVSGALMVGFSFYHNSLYNKKDLKPKDLKTLKS